MTARVVIARRPCPVAVLGADAAAVALAREAGAVAAAHVAWAAAEGLHPCDVLVAIRSRQMVGDWAVVRVELARAWIEMQRECVA